MVLFYSSYSAPGAREWTGVGEDSGSEVEPKGREHEVELRLYICCTMKQYFEEG